MIRVDLKKIRKDLGMTQRQLSDIFGVPQSFVSQIENAKDPMPGHWTVKLLGMLNIPDLSPYQVLICEDNSKQDILNRFRAFIDAKGLNQGQVAMQLGLTQRILNNIFKGDTKMGVEFFMSISKGFPELDMNWLWSGKGNMMNVTTLDLDRITALVDTIATLQAALNDKSKTIAILNERIKQLESQNKK